jgi:O-methyltransferase/methyltransferase family protein
MADDIAASRTELRQLINGFRVTQALNVLVVTGVADALAGGPRTSDDLADSAGLHPSALYRLLRALASLGVLEEDESRSFKLTPLGDGLRSEAPDSLAAWTAYEGSHVNWETWGNLAESVRTGETAYRLLFGVDSWTHRASHPEDQALFDRAMVSLTGAASQAVANAYDFSRFRCVVDVGGGHGGFLGVVLARNPSLTGVLFDQPHVIAGALDVLRDFGVADRWRIESGSFFDSIPPDGDAYILKSVIHDWDDKEACRILAVCGRCMRPGPSWSSSSGFWQRPTRDLTTSSPTCTCSSIPAGWNARSTSSRRSLMRAASGWSR